MSNPMSHNDDLFRQKMDDFREMPSDHVWAGVADALDQKKKRRFIIWFWMGGLGFAASAIGALFILNSIHQTGKMNVDNSQQKQNKIRTEQNSQSTEKAREQQTNDAGNSVALANKTIISPNGHVDLNITKVSPEQNTNGETSKEINATNKIPRGNTIQHHGMDLLPADKNAVRNTGIPSAQDPMELADRSNEISAKIATTNTYRQKPETYPHLESVGIYDTFIKDINTILPRQALAPRFRGTVSVYGYTGGIAYQRNSSHSFTNEPNTIVNNPTNKNKRFGLYAATAIKAGFIHRKGIYMNIGIGYETQRFAGRQQFMAPPITNSPPPVDGLQNNPVTNTSFGEVGLPLDMGSASNPNIQSLGGKLVYQSHQIFFPVDFGYSFLFKKFGIDLGTSAAFHLPISQKAMFYPDQGDTRELITNQLAPFNFSLGFEPSVSYSITQHLSIMAGGTFRYHVLDTYKGTSSVSRPYVLTGNLGLKYAFHCR